MVLPVTTLDALFGAALLVPDAIDAGRAAAIRQQCRGFTRYALLDRGSYDVLHDPNVPEAIELVTRAAERATGRSLMLSSSRIVRLVAGDYVLAHHDSIYEDNPVEVTLDLSPAAVPDAEVHYRRSGQVFFRVPSTPGVLAIVERGVTITCNHTYVSKLHRDADVWRLIVLLRDSAPALHTTRSA
jgi:hypothetical protein